jgi:hypothetical protein
MADDNLRTSAQPLNVGTPNAVLAFDLFKNESVMGVNVTGLTGDGATLTLEGSSDAKAISNATKTWFAIVGVPFTCPSPAVFTTLTTDQSFKVDTSGLTNIRVRVSGAGAGTALVGLNAIPGAAMGVCGGTSSTATISGSSIAAAASTLPLTAATTAYTSGLLIASSATAGSVVVPSITLPAQTGFIPRLRLSINDATSTAWGGTSIQIDLWSSAPTFSTGDRTPFSIATGAASHLGSYSCTMSPEYGDGVYAECAPSVGATPSLSLSGTTVYWTAKTLSGGGVTAGSKVMTLTAEVVQ